VNTSATTSASVCLPQMHKRASLSAIWWIYIAHYGGQTMVNDLNIGGVFIPGLLVTALAALACTLALIALLSLSRLYRRLPFRPLLDVSTYLVTFFLLMQGLTALGLFR
jgi:hypothetical protein